MFTHNIVVRHANGEYEGFSGCGSTAEAAERNAKAKAARDIDAKLLDPARVSYLTKPEFDALDDGTKATIRKDWWLSSHPAGSADPEGEFKGEPHEWGIRSAYSRISRIAAPNGGVPLPIGAMPDWEELEKLGGDCPKCGASLPAVDESRWGKCPECGCTVRLPRGRRMSAARRYQWGGELLTKAQMLSKAVAKEIVFMGNDDAPTFHAVMDEPEGELHGDERSDMKAGVFPITQTEFDRLRAEDATTPQARERYLAFRVKELSGKLSTRDAVDFNSWARRNNPNPEEKVAYLQRILFGLAGVPAKFTPPDMSRPAP